MSMASEGINSGIRAALLAAFSLGAISTLGDFIWATWIPRHRMPYGMAHGALLFLCVGFFLGRPYARAAAGALGGVLIGTLAAGSFYALRPLAGPWLMLVLWLATWIALGFLNEYFRSGRFFSVNAALRGLLAAAGFGVAFYLISGIWFPFDPQGWDYLLHFAGWTFAYLPGFAALLAASRPSLSMPARRDTARP